MTDEPLWATISMKAVLFGPGGRVLLLHDSEDDCWEFPGGRLDVDERPVDGLRRELDEETGMGDSVTVDRPVHTHAWENTDGQGRFAAAYRAVTTETAVDLSHEHDDFVWVAPEDAGARLDGEATRALELARGVGDGADADAGASGDANADGPDGGATVPATDGSQGASDP
jgi:8-oxo-dGTP pyrophosphatase MutT (NUDIX family)